MREPLLGGGALPGTSLQKACRLLVAFCALHLTLTLLYYLAGGALRPEPPPRSRPPRPGAPANLSQPEPPRPDSAQPLRDCPATSPLLGKCRLGLLGLPSPRPRGSATRNVGVLALSGFVSTSASRRRNPLCSSPSRLGGSVSCSERPARRLLLLLLHTATCLAAGGPGEGQHAPGGPPRAQVRAAPPVPCPAQEFHAPGSDTMCASVPRKGLDLPPPRASARGHFC